MTLTELVVFLLGSVLVPLGWPLAIIIGLYLFKGQLRKLIDRIETIEPNKVHFGAQPQLFKVDSVKEFRLGEAQVGGADVVLTGIEVAEAPEVRDAAIFDSTALIPTVKSLNLDPTMEVWINAVGAEIDTATPQTKQHLVEYITLAYATARRASVFERDARLIFGSQVRAMKKMVEVGPCTEGILSEYLDQHVKSSDGTVYTSIPAWIQFLRDERFVSMDQARYDITDVGRSFLDFATNNNLTDNSFIY